MQIGMIGPGGMAGNIVVRLLQGGHDVVAYDRSTDAVEAISQQSAGRVD